MSTTGVQRRERRNTCAKPRHESKAMRRKRLALIARNEGPDGLRAAISRSKSEGEFTLAGSGKV